MKDVKIVIGANYGDEGKGLMVNHFVRDAINKHMRPLVVFHNGTAQRGHTVDYTPDKRHVYHHFCSGTAEGAPTFYAKTFLLHPMEFTREFLELTKEGMRPPMAFYDPMASVITPFDMLVDQATEEWIAKIRGEREYGSCGFGSWCAAEDRLPKGTTDFPAMAFREAVEQNYEMYEVFMEAIWKECQAILIQRGVDIEKTSFADLVYDHDILMKNFYQNLRFFFARAKATTFEALYASNQFDSFIFENGQGLGLDMNVDNDWHTTSNTGMVNPYAMLKDKNDFSAEVCYVTRSYLTRHGVGPLEEAVAKSKINADMVDNTNVPNTFQGSLRYGYLEDNDQKARIRHDSALILPDNRFKIVTAVTHTNEFDCGDRNSKYFSDNPFGVKERE